MFLAGPSGALSLGSGVFSRCRFLTAVAVQAFLKLFQMHGCFGLLVAAGSLSYFWDAVFWLDIVAACFAVDAAFGGLWCGHRAVYCDFAFGFDDSLYF